MLQWKETFNLQWHVPAKGQAKDAAQRGSNIIRLWVQSSEP